MKNQTAQQVFDDSEDFKVLIDASKVDSGIISEFEKLLKPSKVSDGHYSFSYKDEEDARATGVMVRRFLKSKGAKVHVSYQGGPWNMGSEGEEQPDVWNVMVSIDGIPTDLMVKFMNKYLGRLELFLDNYDRLTFKEPFASKSDCLKESTAIREFFNSKGFTPNVVPYPKSMILQVIEPPKDIPQTSEDDRFLVDLLSGNDSVPKPQYGWNALINVWGADEGLIDDFFDSYAETLQTPYDYMTSFTKPFADKLDCFRACKAIRKFFTSQGSSVKVKPYQENEAMHTEQPKKAPVKKAKAPKVARFPVDSTRATFISDNRSEWISLGKHYEFQLASMNVSKAWAARQIGCSATSLSNFCAGKPMRLAGVIEHALDLLFEVHNLKQRYQRFDDALKGAVQ